MMKETFYNLLLGNATFGYACHEIIFGRKSLQADYRIIDVNKTFEAFAGQVAGSLTGKRVSELLADKKGVMADMRNFYKTLSGESENGRFEFFSEKSKRWFDVQVIRYIDGYLVTLLEDITQLKSLQTELDNTGYLLIENERYSQISKLLTESENNYRSLTEQLPVGVYRTTIEGQLIYANMALSRILNYESVDELLALDVMQLYVNPDDRHSQVKFAKDTSAVLQSEFQLKRKTGEFIWVLDNCRLIFDKDNHPVYFDGILEDITEKKQSEMALKETKANLVAILENTLESIWSVNLNYEIQYVNEVFASAFLKTFGKQLYPGVKIIDILPDTIRKMWIEHYDKAFQNNHFLFEDRIDINGTSIYVEVAMNPIVVDNKVVGVSVYGKDVTEKKLVELQLQYQSDLRKLLAELSTGFINIPIKEINEAINHSLIRIGEFVGADRVYILEYDFRRNTVTNTFEWCAPDIEPAIRKVQNLSMDFFEEFVPNHRKGHVFKIEDVKQMPQNNLRKILEDQDVLSLLTIPLIMGGDCIGSVGFDSVRKRHIYNNYEQQLLQVYAQMLVNIMERQEKEQKLIAAKEKAEEGDKLKSAFLANLSHEIRTPMSGIIGFLNLLNEPDLSEENKNTYINIVTQSGHRLLDTINDIIEISRIESGGSQINITSVNVSELMGYFSGFFRQQTTQKGLDYIINNRLPANIRFFRSDRKKLDSIILNLLKNAIKFTISGSVELGCHLEEDKIVFYVKDTGVGIPEDRIGFIFERFVQVDLTTSRPHEGSGLGLSIVRAYVEMLHGTIKVMSEVGKGTTFTFSIPYIADNGVKTINEQAIRLDDSVKASLKILIAEDDYASYLYIQKAISLEGAFFLHTKNGEDTVESVRSNPDLSLLLMDIKMPGMSGLEATRKIREFNKTIPIIAQTAYSLSGDREMAIEAGCNDYISKPINRKELQNLIMKYIGEGS